MHNLEHNPTEKLFIGRVPFIRATSFFSYQKHTNYAHLIHKLKYQHRDDIGTLLGEMCGVELQKSGFLSDVDALVPIPLHPRRERKRGYNQSEIIAKGISEVTGVPVLTSAIIRSVNTKTQTRKNKTERAQNVSGIFSVQDATALEGKHIVIIDDVITTGATCISCAETILKESNVKGVSFVSIALA